VDHRFRQALDTASDQNALITRSQLRSLGLTNRVVGRAVADGLMIRVCQEVFRLRGAPQTERMAINAATLGAGGHASGSTAALLLQLEAPLARTPLHVTVDVARQHPRSKRLRIETEAIAYFPVRIHRCGVGSASILNVDGVPCAAAARTLFDIAPALAVDELEDAFERARRLGLVSIEALARSFEIHGGRGRPGTNKVRTLLANSRPNPLESKLEGKAWRMLQRSRIPEPARQVRVDLPSKRWHRLDFAWPELLVAFETEGFEWHGTRARWKRDRVRTAALERLGWRILVVTWDDVTRRRAETLDRIAMARADRQRLSRRA
jgi:very-short-patch-repair endonuclease